MDEDVSRDQRTLRRIAATLDIPVADLFLSRGEAGSVPSSFEIEDLLRMFGLLRDPRARARVIATAEAEVQKTRQD